MNLNSTQRFTDRVEDYVKYRPSYPAFLIGHFKLALGLKDDSVIVDVGSGTGISAELFLENGNPVYGVEPNQAMRAAAERTLKDYPNFTSVDGTAEATGLPDGIADFVVAAQAFHWFDAEKSRAEFQRLLKPEGYALLIWNARRVVGTPFSEEYEALLNNFGTDYGAVRHRHVDLARIRGFLGSEYRKDVFYNMQEFDYEGLLGRLLSSSYAPKEGHPRFNEMLHALRVTFDKYEKNGVVKMEYDTEVYYSQLRTN